MNVTDFQMAENTFWISFLEVLKKIHLRYQNVSEAVAAAK